MEFGLVALWLVTFFLFLYAGALILDAFFPRLSEQGAIGLGLPLALTVLWIVTFWVGHLSFVGGIAAGVVVLLALVALASTRGPTLERRLYVETAVVFALAFGLVILIRAYNPAIVSIGGEKFLDFGLLQTILRADSLPIEDMWFAGEPLRYYYGGHFLAAILTEITWTPGRYAYNLALAGFYAMLVTAMYGLAGAIASKRGVSRRLGAVFGAFLVGIASNLSTPGKLLLWVIPDSIATTVSETFGIAMDGLATGIEHFDYWDASRVIVDEPSDFAFYEPASPLVINEFPFFAFLNADLHAHMLSPPFLVLACGLLLAYYWTPPTERVRRLAILFGAVPIVTAQIAVTNTWTLPTIGGLTVLTVALGPADPRTLLPERARTVFTGDAWRGEAERIGIAIGVAGLVLALGVLWSMPFWPGPAGNRPISFLPDRTSLGELLVVHGAFIAVFAAYLYRRGTLVVGREDARIGLLVTIAAIAIGSVLDIAAVGLFLPPILIGWFLLRREALPVGPESVSSAVDTDGSAGYETVLVIAGAGLVILVEFVFFQENVGRMNTVFKYYWEVWVFFSIAGGVAIAWLFDGVRPSRARLTGGWLQAFVAVLVVSTSLYTGLALDSQIDPSQEATLDGLAYLEERHPSEAEAIHWLNTNVSGKPNIVTAAPGGYRWQPSAGRGASAPASLTGIPTVLGWFHVAQHRGEAPYNERLEAVRTIYAGSNTSRQAALLRTYNVRYVYVGPAERARYDEITVESLAGVTVEKQWPAVTIYLVNQSALPA